MGKTGIFGKHPAFGDFIGADMSKPMQVKLEEWLGAILPRARDNLGHVWQPFYDIALPLRFWIGEAALPREVAGPVAGVMVFSHDKVGRRFPLIALSEAGTMPPPTVNPDQRWYEALQNLMLEHDTPETAGELAQMLTLPPGFEPAASEGGEASFWAVHSAGAVSEMLSNVAATDHRRAARPRSYWWSAGDRSRTATFHTLEGWPDAEVFQWLLSGNPAEEEPEPEPAPQPLPEPDAFLVSNSVADAPDDSAPYDPWAAGGTPKVPAALYGAMASVDPLDDDGPQSPFDRPKRDEAEVEPEESEDALIDDDVVGDIDDDEAPEREPEETVESEADAEDEDTDVDAEDGADENSSEDTEAASDSTDDSDGSHTDENEGETPVKPGRDSFAEEAE